MIISAPYPSADVTMILPNPKWNDFKQNQSTVTVHTMTDGTIRTYIKGNNRTLLSFQFSDIAPLKIEEIKAVFAEYHDKEMRLFLTWKNQSYRAYLKTNPWQAIFGAKDAESLAFEFEGIEI